MVNVQNELPFSQDKLLCDAVECTLRLHKTAGDVNILIVDLERMRELNRAFRGIDAPTDVLTFPADTDDTMFSQDPDFLGDIAICLPRAQEQAIEYGHSLERELAFLAVHGTLHILQYDHLTPDDEACMIAKQKEVLQAMGLGR